MTLLVFFMNRDAVPQPELLQRLEHEELLPKPLEEARAGGVTRRGSRVDCDSDPRPPRDDCRIGCR